MNQERLGDQNAEKKDEKVGSTFFDFIAVTVHYRKFLFWFVLIITAGATTYALLSPKWYKSTASVFPAEKTDLLSSLSGLTSLAKGFSAGRGLAALAGSSSESDKYIAIIKSATITNDVIKKFDLRKEYEYENDFYEKVVKEWQSNLEVEIQDEGNLTISVYDKNPQKAADIVNYLVEKLNAINTELGVQNAKANRIFVEKRYFQNVDDITNLESAMKAFQQKYGVIAVPQQIEATVKSMSSIYVDLYKKEIELNVLKQTYGENHPLTANAKIELNELQKKIDQLNAGTDSSQKDVNLLIPFKKAPELGNEYLKIYRNLEIQYKIIEFIQPLYEQAKIEEVRNTPSVLVLDKAAPAERKSKPKIALYLLLAFVISTSIGFIIIIIIEGTRRLRNIDSKRFDLLVNAIKSDFKIFRRK
ncbi:MAG: GumC family protein [Melioribacteraceae bacterium]